MGLLSIDELVQNSWSLLDTSDEGPHGHAEGEVQGRGKKGGDRRVSDLPRMDGMASQLISSAWTASSSSLSATTASTVS